MIAGDSMCVISVCVCVCLFVCFVFFFFFFQAEDGIRDLVRSRGLGMCIRDSSRAVPSPDRKGSRETPSEMAGAANPETLARVDSQFKSHG